MRPTDSPPKTAGATASSIYWRDIIVVVAVAWAARLAFMWLIPPGARSFDAFLWEHQAILLNSGVNPYHANTYFNWPPFWMQCIFIISKIAGGLDISFFRVLQVFLILFETAAIAATVQLIRMLAPTANTRAVVIIGMALNPPAILLVCQHCNFDVIMVLWVLLALLCLVRYNASDNLADWLGACLFLGLGILTKTVPLVLVPLLAGGLRQAAVPAKLLGAALLLGPVTLGLSVIYVLSPVEVVHNVIGYRAGDFPAGFTGLLYLLDGQEFYPCIRLGFYLLGLGIMALTWHYLWTKRSLGNCELVLYTALMLMLVAGEGMGFGAQYFYWFLPFLVISYACHAGPWRKLLIGFGLVGAITLIINYGLGAAYGYNFLLLYTHTSQTSDLVQVASRTQDAFLIHLAAWSDWLSRSGGVAWETLPLFIAGIAVLVFGGHRLLSSVEGWHKKWILRLAGCYALCIIVIFALAIGFKSLGSSPATPGDSNPGQTNQSQ